MSWLEPCRSALGLPDVTYVLTGTGRFDVIAGDTIYLRGQIGQNLDTSETVGVGDVTAQAEQAMTNIDLLLREAGSSLQDIVKVTVYLVDPRYREPVYRVMGRWLTGVYPVSTELGPQHRQGRPGSSPGPRRLLVPPRMRPRSARRHTGRG